MTDYSQDEVEISGRDGPSSEKYSVNYKKEEYFHFNVEGWLTLLIINGLLFSLQFCFCIRLYTGSIELPK